MKGEDMADNMLIDGLIKFCDEKSKNIKLKAEPQVFIEIKQALEDLKEYKLKEFQCHLAQEEGITIGYNKAIDEFAEKLSLEISESIIWDMLATMSKNSSLSDTSDEIVDYVIDTSKKIAEQMKAGNENG